jgi:hypothetical protein
MKLMNKKKGWRSFKRHFTSEISLPTSLLYISLLLSLSSPRTIRFEKVWSSREL